MSLFKLATEGLFLRGTGEKWEDTGEAVGGFGGFGGVDMAQAMAGGQQGGAFFGGLGHPFGAMIGHPFGAMGGGAGEIEEGEKQEDGVDASHYQEQATAAVLPRLDSFTLDMAQSSTPHFRGCLEVVGALKDKCAIRHLRVILSVRAHVELFPHNTPLRMAQNSPSAFLQQLQTPARCPKLTQVVLQVGNETDTRFVRSLLRALPPRAGVEVLISEVRVAQPWTPA